MLPLTTRNSLQTILAGLIVVGAIILAKGAFSAEAASAQNYQEFVVPDVDLAYGQTDGLSLVDQEIQLLPAALHGTYTSPTVRAPQAFTDIGAHWHADLGTGAQLNLQIRTSPDGQRWTAWEVVSAADELMTARDNETFAPLLFVPQTDITHRYLQFQITLQRSALTTVINMRDLTFFLVDASRGPTTDQAIVTQNRLNAQSNQPASVGKPAVISRTAWGSPDGQGSRWTPRYATVHHIIIHHTVTPNTDTNWAQRVRGIWNYHAISLNWGDIGYNFLIDPNGNIYEGRAGGDDAIAAHASSFNPGTMGVSFIGCFDSSCAASWGDRTPKPAALSAAAALIAWKVDQRGLNPEGSGTQNGVNYPIIAGHRSVSQTSCPGNSLYDRLPPLRADVKARLNPERDNVTLTYGQTDSNTISPANDRDTYFFAGTTGQNVRITMNKAGSSIDSFVELYKPDGGLLGTDDDSGGDRNSRLDRTLPANGTYRIVAHSWNDCCTGNYQLGLALLSAGDTDDNRWITFGQSLDGTITPNDDRDTYYFNATAGRLVSIKLNKLDAGLDPLVELWGPNGNFITLNDDGGGDRNSWLLYQLPQAGTYRIIARSWNVASSGRYRLSLIAEQAANLAIGKRTVVSSIETSWLTGPNAVDNNLTTRWSSLFQDPGWIYVDLGQDMSFDQVVLKWETAYGRTYGLYIQPNSQSGTSNWTNVYYTTSGDGGTDTLNFNRVTARYVLMHGTQRGTPWGYSLWEFQIFDRAATPAPLVPPDPGDKGDEAVPLSEPPSPADIGKDIDLVGEGEDSQENEPLATGSALSMTLDTGHTYTLPIASISVIGPLTVTHGNTLTLSGTGQDPDGGAIAEYRWYVDFVGGATYQDDNALPLISETASFDLDTSSWPGGAHTVYFQVRDDEGEWSALKAIQITIQYRVNLPLMLR